MAKITIWDILFWIAMLILIGYILGKLLGLINTPEWVDLIPLITIVFLIGIFYQKVVAFIDVAFNEFCTLTEPATVKLEIGELVEMPTNPSLETNKSPALAYPETFKVPKTVNVCEPFVPLIIVLPWSTTVNMPALPELKMLKAFNVEVFPPADVIDKGPWLKIPPLPTSNPVPT